MDEFQNKSSHGKCLNHGVTGYSKQNIRDQGPAGHARPRSGRNVQCRNTGVIPIVGDVGQK